MPRRAERRAKQGEETQHIIELHALGDEMEKVFGYLYDLSKNLMDHADHFDEIRACDKTRKEEVANHGYRPAALREDLRQTQEIVNANDRMTKGIVEQNDANLKNIVEQNDANLKNTVQVAVAEIWEFHRRNNNGIGETFAKMDARLNELDQKRADTERSFQKLKDQVDNVTAVASTSPPMPTMSSTPAASVPVDPQSLTGCGLVKLREDVRGMEDKVNLLEVQVSSLAGSQCPCISGRCPCPCSTSNVPRGVSGNCGHAQGDGTSGDAQGQGPARDDKGDPWWRAFESPGPGGPGGGSGPGGGPGGPDHFDIGTPMRGAGRRLRQIEYGKLFEVKDAKILPSFNGKEKGSYWHKKITFYLASRCPEITAILKWVEKQEDPVTDKSLRSCPDTDGEDAVILSRHLWGFLNVTLTDDAWEIFENIDKGDGFEAWRQVLANVVKKTRIEKIRLERMVLNPPQCQTNDQVPMALERWAGAYKTYRDYGGEPLSDERRKGAVMSMLPEALQEKIVWDFDDYKTADALVSWIRTKVRLATSWKPGRKDALMIAEEEDLSAEIRALGEDASEEQIMAIVSRRFPRKNGAPAKTSGGAPIPRGPGAPGKLTRDSAERGPPRSREDVTCPNCLKKGHFASECTEPKVERKDRMCFNCGDKGHVARFCKKPKKSNLIGNLQTDGDQDVWACLNDTDDFIPVQRQGQSRRARKPVPMERRLETFLDVNKFSAFLNDMPDDEEELTLEDVAEKILNIEDRNDFPVLGKAKSGKKRKNCKCCPGDAQLERERDEFLALLIGDDEEDEELNMAEEEFITMEVTADSGAGDHVASKADAPGHPVKESAASRRGGKFVGAGGHKIPNQGEMLVRMEAPCEGEDESSIAATFQGADVCRPLFSVARICDKGNNTMTFDKSKALVKNPHGKVLCKFERQGNLYVAKMKVRNPKHSSFGRPGP